MTSYSTAFSHVVLAGTGVFCYLNLQNDCRCFPVSHFARCSFTTIIVNSAVGVWRYGNPVYGDDAEKVYKYTSLIQDLIVLPCIVSTLWLSYAYQQEFAFANLVIPTIPLVSFALDKKAISTDLSDTIVILNSLTLAIISYVHDNYYGLAACLSYTANHFGVRKGGKGEYLSIPTQDLYNYAMCFFAYFALRTLLD